MHDVRAMDFIAQDWSMVGGSKEPLCGPHAMDKANNDLLPAEGFDQVMDVTAKNFVDWSK